MPPLSAPVLSRIKALDPPVCVALAAASATALLERAQSCLPNWPFLELRLDILADPATGPGVLRELATGNPGALLLATCRPERSGGQLRGSGHDELSLLLAAADAGAALVDLSLETAEELGPAALAALRARGAAVLLSFHDFHGTGNLQAVLARMRPFAPDIAKVVSTANSLRDSLTVLDLAAQADLPVVALAMGEAGVLTRVLAPRAGALFTFAAAADAEATAPGQLSADRLHSLYRIGQISPATRVFGVAGDPIHSSLSPLMLNTAFRETGTDAVYLPLKTADAAELFGVARTLPLAGFSVTMPLKQAVLPLLDQVDPLAARIGAVNTVHRTPEGQLHGYNTDAAGIVVPLERRVPLQGARVLVLGAGGAARAAVFGCVDRGAQVFVHNRTAAAAQQLARQAGAVALDRGTLAGEPFDVLINATPAGMRGQASSLPLAENELHARVVFDLVYNPTDTPLLQLARARGLDTIAGVEMFVYQGARQFEIWTGQPAPAEAMQASVEQALAARSD